MFATHTTTTFPAIKNAARKDGSLLPETFGTVRVLRSTASATHEFDYCSDGSLIVTNMDTHEAIRLNQSETVQLCAWLGIVQEQQHDVKQDLH